MGNEGNRCKSLLEELVSVSIDVLLLLLLFLFLFLLFLLMYKPGELGIELELGEDDVVADDPIENDPDNDPDRDRSSGDLILMQLPTSLMLLSLLLLLLGWWWSLDISNTCLSILPNVISADGEEED